MNRILSTILIGVPAIVVIGAIEIYALCHGVNGVGLSMSVGAICTIAGFGFGKIKRDKKNG